MSDAQGVPTLGQRLLLPALACLTLGLAPYAPMPHVVEKLLWLFRGQSFAPIDVFDLVMHGAPWAWLALAVVRRPRKSG
ncbi:MAG: RND transporter [Vicinamibacteria bacterium]|jgi:hypothetical protein|nr:RND transporter [Vicinamibacteria bacterium]